MSGMLLKAIEHSVKVATEAKTLVSFTSAFVRVLDQGNLFLVRVATNLKKKPKLKELPPHPDVHKSPPRDPFLPPFEKGLHVSDLDRHVVLLNKFNVFHRHILICPKEFEHQNVPLNTSDFQETVRCLRETGGLAFYNRGPESGFSQQHKHLQVIPDSAPGQLDALQTESKHEPDKDPLPIFTYEYEEISNTQWYRVRHFNFKHACVKIDFSDTDAGLAETVRRQYEGLLKYLGINESIESNDSFNLLMTKRWVMVVPRRSEYFVGSKVPAPDRTFALNDALDLEISMNSLAFAGSFFVKSETALERIREVGPLQLLSQLTFPA